MLPARMLLFCLAFLAFAPEKGAAQDRCTHPRAYDSFAQITETPLALRNKFGIKAVESDCVILDRDTFGASADFYLLPKNIGGSGTIYVFIKSYRTLNPADRDQIKMSRGGGWYFPKINGSLPRRDDEPFQGTIAEWDKAHSAETKPEEMARLLKSRWHAYADSDLEISSNRKPAFWQARKDFDFSSGTLTNYLIAFPAGSKTEPTFHVGLASGIKRFELEFLSNTESLGDRYTFEIRY